MPTDIRLDEVDGNWMIVESAILKSTASDLMLDAPSRRSGGGGPHRRALVHDDEDGLTINFNGDYPAGVTVDSDLRVRGRLLLSDAALALLDHLVGADTERIERIERSIQTLADRLGASVVPPWRTRMEVLEGDSMGLLFDSAERLGFEVEWSFVPDHPVFSLEEVVSIDPPPGSVAPVGTRLRITIVGTE